MGLCARQNPSHTVKQRKEATLAAVVLATLGITIEEKTTAFFFWHKE